MEIVTCEKYYDKVREKWPELTEKQIDKIVKRGLRVMYMYNLYGGDVLLKHPKYTMYFGKLFRDNLIFYKYWRIKWKIKLRIKYRQHKTKYDGYYYFGLTEKEYQKYLAKTKSNGRKRSWFTFEKLMLFKIPEECFLDAESKHFFRLKYPEDCGFTMYKVDYKIKDFEYIYKRDKDKSIKPVSYEQTNSNKCVKRRVK